jgi:hypothetical protein
MRVASHQSLNLIFLYFSIVFSSIIPRYVFRFLTPVNHKGRKNFHLPISVTNAMRSYLFSHICCIRELLKLISVSHSHQKPAKICKRVKVTTSDQFIFWCETTNGSAASYGGGLRFSSSLLLSEESPKVAGP